MIEPQWIRLDAVLAIHAEQLAEHGGLEGLRDRSGLESAIASPRNLLAYGSNQVFIDGNKRTALVVCRTFLILNGHDLDASQDEKYTVIMKMADREIDAATLAAWIRARLIPAQ